MTIPTQPATRTSAGQPIELESAVIRLAGDSGDGIQLAGSLLARLGALAGLDVCVLPDFPAEIRAPAGSLAGVSGYQVHFSSTLSLTPGDRLGMLAAMNPAALRKNLADLEPGGLLILNRDAFERDNLIRAGYDSDPLTDGSLADYRVASVPVTLLNRSALQHDEDGLPTSILSARQAERCQNFFLLGMICRLYGLDLEPAERWIEKTFLANAEVREANCCTLQAGYRQAAAIWTPGQCYHIHAAPIAPGRYRTVSGAEALAMGLIAAGERAGLPLLFAASASTPASELMHQLTALPQFNLRAFQAEDDAAAIGAALGASFGGVLGVTATSGPGMDVQAELLGLGVMTELPLVVINLQRAGPSTGLPTRSEQADLLQALFGRHGEAPVVVLAPRSPGDCFAIVLEAVSLAAAFRTPVVVLADAYLAHGAELWQIPSGSVDSEPPIEGKTPHDSVHGIPTRAAPGTPGREHRIGGLEKDPATGHVSFDPVHHEQMVAARAEKIAGVASAIPEIEVDGPEVGPLLVLGWGSTYGAIRAAVGRVRARGGTVAQAHLRYLSPWPRNLGQVLARYTRVLIPELNLGQLRRLIRSDFLIDAAGLNKVQGRPFLVSEIESEIEELLGNTECPT